MRMQNEAKLVAGTCRGEQVEEHRPATVVPAASCAELPFGGATPKIFREKSEVAH